MAQQYDNRAKNLMLDALTAVAVRVALHTGDPGAADTADNEVTGGNPAYARKAISWSAASAGVADASDTPVFDVPASTTVSWVSFWNSAVTQRYAKKQLASNEVFGAQGTLTLIDGTQLDLSNDPA